MSKKIRKEVNNLGTIFYYDKKDRYHRTDGPAIEWVNGYKEWYLNGLLHRTDGPAIEWTNGNKDWWIKGKHLTEEEFKKQTNKLYKILYA